MVLNLADQIGNKKICEEYNQCLESGLQLNSLNVAKLGDIFYLLRLA